MRKKKDPLISVILNCYNGERYLTEALKSIINQRYKNWELIFWDNRSDDNSKRIFDEFVRKNSSNKLKYYKSITHTTLYKARNLAIQKAKGKFISFIDADDLWESDKLTKQIKLFKDNDVGVVYGNLWLENKKTNKKKKYINFKLPEGYVFSKLIDNYYVGIISCLIKRSILKKNIFDNKYNIIGDFDLIINLARHYKFKAVQKPIATYRLHDNNLSNKNKEVEIFEYNYWLKKNKFKLNNYQYLKIKKKIEELKFLNIKVKKSFFYTLNFFLKSKNLNYNLKNFIILFLPLFLLKRFVWFL